MPKNISSWKTRDVVFSFVTGVIVGFSLGITLGYYLFSDFLIEHIRYIVG